MVERVLAGRGFNIAEVSEWCDEIGAETVAALAQQHPGYRFAGAYEIAACETDEIERLIKLASNTYPRIGSDGHHRAAGERRWGQHGLRRRVQSADR